MSHGGTVRQHGLSNNGIPGNIWAILALAAPIILSQLAQIATGVVDLIMAGRLGPTVQGAVSTGGAIWTPTMIFLLGLLYALTHGIGALRGQGREQEIGSLAAIGCIVGLLGGSVLGLFIYFGVGPLFNIIGVAPDLVEGAVSYARLVAFGFPGLGLFLALRFLLEASNGPVVVTITILCSVATKIGLNRLLVFGDLGMTPMGVAGFGLSTAIVFWGMALMLAGIVFLVPRFRAIWHGRVSAAGISLARIFAFIRQGIPIGLNFLSDYLVMAVVALFIASIGAVAISSHQVVFNIVSVFLMITTGISMAGAILVSKVAGGKSEKSLKSMAGSALGVSIIVAIVISLALAVYGGRIIAIYSPEPEVQAAARGLLNIAAALFTIDVVAISLGFILRGVGKPGIPFIAMLVSHWAISIPLGYILAETTLLGSKLGVPGWWYGLLGGLTVAAVAMSIATLLTLGKYNNTV